MFFFPPFSLLSSMNSFAKRFILEEEKRGKLRNFPCQTFAKKLLARFASYVDHINLVFYMLNDSFDLMTIFFSVFGDTTLSLCSDMCIQKRQMNLCIIF